MKKTNLAIAIICAVLCLLGWVMMTNDNATQASEYKEHVTLADSYVKEGLYQRAILEYMAAFENESNEEIAEKIAAAYALRFEEDREGTFDPCVDDLELLLGVYPANEKITMQLAQLYMDEGNYKKAYTWLANAAKNGAQGQSLLQMLQTARYAYNIRANSYHVVKPAYGKTYVVGRNKLWGLYNLESGLVWDCEYAFVSQANEDGVVLVTMEKDSRLIDGEGMVLGIFKEKVVDAGVYGDGLIAVSTGGNYAYYNEFAKKQFGDYEQAGTFVDGHAAVKKNGKWQIVDKQGNVCSDSFVNIVLNVNGEYISNGVILAAPVEGQYKIYDKQFEEKANLGKLEDLDILTEDGLIAVCQNGKWGFVNTAGEMVIKPVYEEARSFSNGLAAVCKDGLWGYIDRNNTLVIDYQFLGADYFNGDGSAMVCTEQVEVVVERDDLIEDLDPEGVFEDTEAGTDADGETEGDVDLSDETSEYTPDEDPLPAVTDTTVIEYELQDTWGLLVLYNGIVED